MGNTVAKVIEISASSDKGIEDAVQGGLKKVSRSVKNIKGAWVNDIKVVTDNDGHITQMIRKSPTGRFIKDPNNPGRLMQAKNDELGEYEILGSEGIDNDGDGRVNEDGEGFYDYRNRDLAQYRRDVLSRTLGMLKHAGLQRPPKL